MEEWEVLVESKKVIDHVFNMFDTPDSRIHSKYLRVVVTTDSRVSGLGKIAPEYSEGKNPKIGRCEFFLNPKEEMEADFWIVFANARPMEKMRCSPENTLFIAAEPESKKVYPKAFYRQFHQIIDTHKQSGHPRVTLHAPCLSWQFGFNHLSSNIEIGFRELEAMKAPEAVLNKVSVVCSNASFTIGQRERLAFLKRLKEKLGDRLVHFGRGFEPIDDKSAAIQGYRFHLAMENCRAPHYWTEKILDAYLGWAFPLYIGCPNLDEYFPKNSFIALDIKSPDHAADRIAALLDLPREPEEIQAVGRAREQVLYRYNPWVAWARWAEMFYNPTAKPTETMIRSHKAFRPFPRGLIFRIKRRGK